MSDPRSDLRFPQPNQDPECEVHHHLMGDGRCSCLPQGKVFGAKAPPASDQKAPRVGQVWKEVDTRAERYVRVENVGVGPRSISIRTVVRTNGRWGDGPKSRVSYASPDRFNGKRGGYAYHDEALFV